MTRRLLLLAPSSHASSIPPFLLALTGHPVDPAATSPSAAESTESSPLAGYTSHPPLQLQTKYYSAQVPIWVDEIPLPDASPSPAQWQSEFSGPDAQVVRDAIGALIICLRNFDPPSDSTADIHALADSLRAVAVVRDRIEDERGGLDDDVPVVLVLVGSADATAADDDRPFSVGWWEDQLCDMGLMGVEVVPWDPRVDVGDAKNQFGEYQGMRRIREILETHHWSAPEPDADPDDGLDFDADTGFDLEVNELEREMVGLRFAIERGGDDHVDDPDEGDEETRVDAIEGLLLRMKAIRDMSDELPEQERKRFAAKAVRDIMKEL
ncbi:alpha and gamma adaptin binding protein p34-domain-containing protein [Aspergillus ambiguus]|uniref:adaptin-binding domain-containing protein n=1 Tax=Aspergillus ambiguus TaxID=176160 RepID=UPI003CCE3934